MIKEQLQEPEFVWDPWQQTVLDHHGNVTLRCGRQAGKSTVIGKKGHDFAVEYPGTTTLVIAAGLRQAGLLFEKIRSWFDEDDRKSVERAFAGVDIASLTRVQKRNLRKEASIYKTEPTKTMIALKNGSKIYCVPIGKTGGFIRGFAIDLLLADEAGQIPNAVWLAVVPMLAVSKKLRGFGWQVLLSTPFGKGGYFFDSFGDSDFLHIHVKSTDCKRITKKFIEKERRRLTKMEFAQEYLAEFIDEWNQFYPTKLIMKCCTVMEWNFEKDYDLRKRYFLGVDVARYGGDENAFVVAELDHNHIKIVKIFTSKRVSLTDTAGRIKVWDQKFKFRKIFVDDSGVGGGIIDMLVEDMGRRVVGINNATRSVDKISGKRHQILKQDLHSNVLVLMESFETGRTPDLEMVHSPELINSLKSFHYEYTKDGHFRILSKDNHIAEAMVRACWCIKEKGLKLFVA